MAGPASIRSLKHGSLKIQDGTGAPLSLVIPIDRGELKFTVTKQIAAAYNRAALHSWVEGKEQPCELSFSCVFQDWTGEAASDPTPADALRGVGRASAWVSTNVLSDVFVTDLIFTISAPTGTGDQGETLTFSDFVAETIEFSEAEDGNVVNVSGKALVTEPTSVRA